MAEILAFIGALLLAIHVWKWLAAFAFLLLSPFLWLGKLIAGNPPGSQHRSKAQQRYRRAREDKPSMIWYIRRFGAFIVVGVPVLVVSPALVLTLVAFVLTSVEKRVSQFANDQMKPHSKSKVMGLDAGIRIYDAMGNRISKKVRRAQSGGWNDHAITKIIENLEVPYFGVIGVILLVLSFGLSV